MEVYGEIASGNFTSETDYKFGNSAKCNNKKTDPLTLTLRHGLLCMHVIHS